MFDLKNQTALITGATGGIGAAIARRLHELGAFIYISGSNIDKLENLKKELKVNCAIKQCNLSNSEDVEKLITDIDRLDILVCNAGVTKDMLAIKMKNEDFQSVIDINLRANFILNREAVKKMMKERYGRIINIASVVGVSGNPGQVNYVASKAGLIGMTKSFAMEVASRGITVNAVAPGFIKTTMTDVLTDEQKTHITSKIPMKCLGTPEDIANVVAFLASPLCSYVTGQTLHVNGGMLMI